MTERAIEVHILGDAVGLQKALGSASLSVKVFGGDVVKSANEQVAASVKQREELAALAAEYRQIAIEATKGSDVQIVATQKLAAAQRELGIAYKQTAATAAKSRAEESAFARGMTSKLTGIGGWMAGPGFIGGAALGLGLDSVIKASLGAAESVAHLDQAVKDAHASVQAMTPILEEYTHKAAALGFTNDQTRQAEAELVTAFGATKKSLGDLAVAEDLARARHEDLATAAQQLILLQEGNTRAAKQFGLALPDLTKAQWEQKAAQDGLTLSQEKGKTLYDELLPRIKDQARAFANTPSGKIAEFHAEIIQLEEGIGNNLLPAVTHYLTAVDDWLAKGDNQKRVTEDVQKAVHELTGVLHDTETAIQNVLPYVDEVAHALGGWKQTIEILIGLKVGSTVAGWASGFEKLIGSKAAGSGLAGAESHAGGLVTQLGLLAKFAGMVITVDVIEQIIQNKNSPDGGLAGVGESISGALHLSHLPGALGQFFNPNYTSAGQQRGYYAPPGSTGGIASSPFGGTMPFSTMGVSGGQNMVLRALAAQGWTSDQLAMVKRLMNYEDGSGKPGDHNSSFGPFQLHAGGQLPSAIWAKGPSYAQQWAWSPAGLKWAANNISQFGGLHGGALASALGTHQGSADIPKETAAILGWSMGGGGDTYGPSLTTPGAGTFSGATKKFALPTGANLLSEPLRNALAAVKNKVTDSQGTVAAGWLRVELADLEKARTDLEQQLKGATGKHKAAIQQELRSIDGNIATVNKQITTNLKQQATAIRASFSQTLSTQKSAISSAVSSLKSDLDKQFAAATQAYIDSVLSPQFFQGTDGAGAPLRTASEAQLAQMQADDQLQQLQDSVTNAKTPQDQAAAQRALDEYNLQIQATKERQQADHDYAQAVKQYQDERSQMEAKLNTELDEWGKGLADGTSKLTDLNAIAEGFGLNLVGLADPTTALGFDFSNLSDAVTLLVQTLLAEAAKLGAVGDGGDASKARKTAGSIASGDPNLRSVDGGIISNAAYWAFRGYAPPPMAAGGVVTKPTLVLAGEAGPEAIIPLASAGLGGGGRVEVPVYLDGQEIARIIADNVGRDRTTARRIASAVKPHLDRIVQMPN